MAQKMMSVAESMQATMEKLLIHVDGECPSCHETGTMWQWPTIPGKPSRGGPVCIKCGRRELRRQEVAKATDITIMSRIKKAVGALENSSLVTDKTIWRRNFDNYRTPDRESLEAKQKAMKWAEEISRGGTPHAIITGGTGTGKTHLAVSILRQYLKKTDYSIETYTVVGADGKPIKDSKGNDKKAKVDYSKLCLFVSYRELLEQLKFAMNDPEVRKLITGNLMRDIKTFKVVVIDDLGAELGDFLDPNPKDPKSGKASVFNIDTLTSLTEARIGQATIFTSNLTSTQLRRAYGQRIFSRITDGMGDRGIKFETATDKRRESK